jgi:hypothetical protein
MANKKTKKTKKTKLLKKVKKLEATKPLVYSKIKITY